LKRDKVIIMGAAGRDFHNFNMVYRDNPSFEVVAFTAAQIPFIENRIYPPELAGSLYPEGIPISTESELETLITRHSVKHVAFAYSDVSHEYVMHKASLCLSLGASFVLLGPKDTMLESSAHVISVCAVRTGCGKSIITRKLSHLFLQNGVKTSVIRHPMAYCTLVSARKFSSMGDIDEGACTIEEREEFEPLVERGVTVYAGVDYRVVLDQAERDSRVILWDGGNNDFPFIRPDFEIVLVDAMRPGQETLFYPGEVNLRRGNLVIVTKTNEAKESDLKAIRENILKTNPRAAVLETRSIFTLSDPGLVKGKRALVIEDGPSITHGGMPYGAGISSSLGVAASFVDPRPYAVGSIGEIYARFPHIGSVLPAMGYAEVQIKELEETISRVPADVVIMATPVDLNRIMKIDVPVVRVTYDFDLDLDSLVRSFLKEYAL